MLRTQAQLHYSLPIRNLVPPPSLSKKTSNNSLGRKQYGASRQYNNIFTKTAGRNGFNIRAVVSAEPEKASKVRAVVSVKPSVGGALDNLGIQRGLDDISDLLGKSLLLELVSNELDPKTGKEKATIKGYARRSGLKNGDVLYEAEFTVPNDYEVGAILVENEHHKEIHLHDIIIDGFPYGTIHFQCDSWVQPKNDCPQKRVFFSNKCYLPSQTPDGLKNYRQEDLVSLRGDGKGEMKPTDRIYDYAIYDDLGEPDQSPEMARPPLGGSKQYPYPRRCRTGRPMCKKDPEAETRGNYFYVPRDETFSEIKEVTFGAKTLYSVIHALLPNLEGVFQDKDESFPYFTAIDAMFNEGIDIPKTDQKGLLPRLVKAASDVRNDILQFEPPSPITRDSFFWFRDEEFGRQILSGLNPYSVQLITELPLVSTLDPKIYGPPESAITTEIIQKEIGGIMSVDEAIKEKKLFMLDYYDSFMPYVQKVREIQGTTLYGSRAVYFLTPEGTMKPVAIELARPPMDGKPQWKEVYTPSNHSTSCWLWRLAKAHLLAHDAGFHQLYSHWLRTHCATEPYIIAANRQLSVMHPIYKLMKPHFRYTMEINALAREALINAGGIIESAFSPGKYSIEMSSVLYGDLWRFDHEALPADLISRGLAVEDPSSPHGVKLTVEDYPFANDGLVLFDILKKWVTEYVNHYYPDPTLVASDSELQAWWTEVRTKGHADKKDEPWWPALETPDDLIEIVTTIIWVTSGHHAAVNFGQYAYGGYFPNRATIARTKMPTEDPTDEEWNYFLDKPEAVLLQCFPSQFQATKIMAILDVLSNHSPDEEYIGEFSEPSWTENPVINAAFEMFTGRLKELEGIIDERNANPKLRNRFGAGIVPYELLKPFSEPGVTGKGVPYSISI
ncbi:hypothetical protein ACFE04_007578 [Oxalis oulophora]